MCAIDIIILRLIKACNDGMSECDQCDLLCVWCIKLRLSEYNSLVLYKVAVKTCGVMCVNYRVYCSAGVVSDRICWHQGVGVYIH